MAQKWTSRESEENVLTTEMNSLANGARAITSAALSNDATNERFPYADLELSLAEQGTARSAGAYVEVYFLVELDATNYVFGGSSLTPPSNALVGVFPFDAAVTARVNILTHLLLPQANFHVLVINQTGQAFASSGNTLTMRRYSVEDV